MGQVGSLNAGWNHGTPRRSILSLDPTLLKLPLPRAEFGSLNEVSMSDFKFHCQNESYVSNYCLIYCFAKRNFSAKERFIFTHVPLCVSFLPIGGFVCCSFSGRICILSAKIINSFVIKTKHGFRLQGQVRVHVILQIHLLSKWSYPAESDSGLDSECMYSSLVLST